MKSIQEYLAKSELDEDAVSVSESDWTELRKNIEKINDPSNTGPTVDADEAVKEALNPKTVAKIFESICSLAIDSWRFEDNLKRLFKENKVTGPMPYDQLSATVRQIYTAAFFAEVENALKKYKKETAKYCDYACVQHLKCCKSRPR